MYPLPLLEGVYDTASQSCSVIPAPQLMQSSTPLQPFNPMLSQRGVSHPYPLFEDAYPAVQKRIGSVLFACAMNAVRSPMAEAIAHYYFGKSVYVKSAGVNKGQLDGFAVSALDEIGLNMCKHMPRTIDELEDWEGLNFDLIITLSPEAHHKALDLTRTVSASVEYWPTPDPTLSQGSREQRLDEYRDLRDALVLRIKKRLIV